MIGALRGEWLKASRRPAVWILFGVLLLLVAVLGYLVGWFFLTHPPAHSRLPAGVRVADLKVALYPPELVRQVLSTTGTLGGAIALILGVLSAGSEYGWNTFKTLFSQRPSRIATWTAKVGVTALLVALLTVLVFAVAAACSFGLAHVDGVPVSWPAGDVLLRGLGATWLIYMMWASLGLLFSVIFRQSALAIGLGLVYLLVVESILFGILNRVPSLRDWERPFPGANATALIDSFGHTVIRHLHETTPPPLVSGPQAAIVLALYAAAFLVVAGALLERRDIA